jgi:hypothetical protein
MPIENVCWRLTEDAGKGICLLSERGYLSANTDLLCNFLEEGFVKNVNTLNNLEVSGNPNK